MKTRWRKGTHNTYYTNNKTYTHTVCKTDIVHRKPPHTNTYKTHTYTYL